MRKVLFLTTFLAFVFTSSVWAADVSGTWALTMSGPQGEESFDVVIKAAGEKLTLTANHPMLQAMEGTGTLKGDAIDFSLKATGQMAIEIAFTGKVTGNKMAGTREMNMSGGGGGAPGGQAGGGAPGGEAGGGGQQAAGGPPSGGQQAGGGAPGGEAGGGAPGGQAGGGGAPGGQAGGGGGMDMSSISNEWSAVKK